MKKEKGIVKILWIGDAVTPTGFSMVNHSVIKNLDKDRFHVYQLGVNYHGDPHTYDYPIYPAMTPKQMQTGDMWGITRIEEFINLEPDIIFILNDIWIITNYLQSIKESYKESGKDIPKIVVYFPVDGAGFNKGWFEDFDIVSQTVVYTEFAKNVVNKAIPELALEVIPHGNDKKIFYKIDKTKKEIKEKVLVGREDLWEDSFVVLNVNRNQPRKRIDLALQSFALFAKDLPKNVVYYHHAGTVDAGWSIVRLAERIGDELGFNLQERLILTNNRDDVQKVPVNKLNAIYNTGDVGINTSLGEGWGLTATEHASTGAPQVVPNHTACRELFYDCGLLSEVLVFMKETQTMLDRGIVSPESVAENLLKLYEDKELYNRLSKASIKKFTSNKYSWKNIARQWEEIFENIL